MDSWESAWWPWFPIIPVQDVCSGGHGVGFMRIYTQLMASWFAGKLFFEVHFWGEPILGHQDWPRCDCLSQDVYRCVAITEFSVSPSHCGSSSYVSDVHQPICPFVSMCNRWQTRWEVPHYYIYIYIFLAAFFETPSSWVGNSIQLFISESVDVS